MPKTKKFIDKKHAVTFRLIHRSQRDPLTADERAPQHVLVEQNVIHIDSKDGEGTQSSAVENRIEEQKKYGVFFDDDYNYLQHLKEVKVSSNPVAIVDLSNSKLKDGSKQQNEVKLTLPSSVFASNVEENIGLLNRAAPIRGPQPDLDPDIIAALDSDCDMSDNEDGLDDDFVIKANAPTGDTESDDSEDECSDENQPIASAGSNCSEETSSFEGSFMEEETKSRFTNYSMSSSDRPRNEGLLLLDERFEKIFEEYDDEQIGALDGDEIDGFVKPGDDLLEQAIESFKKGQVDSELSDLRKEAKINGSENYSEEESENDDDDDEETVNLVLEEPAEKWDCESILSTYSNLYNHPKLIKEPPKLRPIKVSRKTGLPIGVISDSGLTAAALKSLDAETSTPTEASTMSRSVPKRDKEETAEEKHNRKQAVKEQRRERRVEKKANTLAFKEEKKKQAKVMLNVQQNLKGIKLS